MHNEQITLTVQVPDGYELTGEFRYPRWGVETFCMNGVAAIDTTDRRPYFILRKSWQPPAWLPEGVWVYRWGSDWYASKDEPVPSDDHPGSFVVGWKAIPLDTMAEWYEWSGETFTPPPVNKIQIDRRPKRKAA